MARRTPHGTTADNEDCRRSGCYLLLGCMSAQACNRHPSRSVVVAVLCIRIISYNSLTALTSSRTWPSSSIMSLSPRVKVSLRPKVRKSAAPKVNSTIGLFPKMHSTKLMVKWSEYTSSADERVLMYALTLRSGRNSATSPGR